MDYKKNGTEDKAQLRALGAYFAQKAEKETGGNKTQKPSKGPGSKPGFTWGFTAQERARLEALRASAGPTR